MCNLIFYFMTLILVCSVSYAETQCPHNTRSLEMGLEYPGITIERQDTVSMDIVIYNRGCSNENVSLQVVQQPQNWTTKIKTYQFQVSDVYVPAAQDKSLTFEAIPNEKVKPGKFAFVIKASTQDGTFLLRQPVHVTVIEKSNAKESDSGVRISTSYPELRGPTDGEFEFSMDVNSRLDKDAIFNLSARGPDGWDINFKPAYESKYISSLRIKSGQNSSVAVEVKPPPSAQIGEYPVNILVQSGDAQAEAALKVILTGTYDLETGTASGLLSLDARAGKKSSVSVYVKNTGSAAQHNIKFMSFKPENWKVHFEPEIVEILEPNDMKQIEVTIEPYEDALVGDYSVSVSVEGEKVDKNVEFRITVKASSSWAWIGIFIIVAVISGLSFIFQRMGRR